MLRTIKTNRRKNCRSHSPPPTWRCWAGGSAIWPTSFRKTASPPSASCPNATPKPSATWLSSPPSPSRPLPNPPLEKVEKARNKSKTKSLRSKRCWSSFNFVRRGTCGADFCYFFALKALQQLWRNFKKSSAKLYRGIASMNHSFVLRKVFPLGLTANPKPRTERNRTPHYKTPPVWPIRSTMLNGDFA